MLVAVLLLLCSGPKSLCAQGTDSVPDAGKLADKSLNAVAGKSGTVSKDIRKRWCSRIYTWNRPGIK